MRRILSPFLLALLPRRSPAEWETARQMVSLFSDCGSGKPS